MDKIVNAPVTKKQIEANHPVPQQQEDRLHDDEKDDPDGENMPDLR